jgi:hypothetical protein
MWVAAGFGLTIAHFVYASEVGLELFRQRGGFTDIGGGWTAIGGVERSLTPVAWLPAGMVFFVADHSHIDGLAGAGVMLLVCGSVAAGVAAVSTMCFSTKRKFGPYAWKLWLTLVLWAAWLPVPFEMTWTYWHTVKY